jgi:hypothetical protein
MGWNYRKRQTISETVGKKCSNPECCAQHPDNFYLGPDDNFCIHCGSKLVAVPGGIKVIANFGKNGITSYSIKIGKQTMNPQKGLTTLSLGNGLSFTQKLGD